MIYINFVVCVAESGDSVSSSISIVVIAWLAR